MSEHRYRIHWRSIATGHGGHGTTRFSEQVADEITDAQNREHKDVIIHWAEEVTGQEDRDDDGS